MNSTSCISMSKFQLPSKAQMLGVGVGVGVGSAPIYLKINCAQTPNNILAMAAAGEPVALTVSEGDAPPSHYVVKLQSFSLLEKNNIDKYISGAFEAGGYKWKLAIHPNGNKARNVSDSLSMYVMMEKEGFFHPGLEVHAVFKIFLLDQNKETYLIFQSKARRFQKMKLEWGFDRLMHLKTFSDPFNGYLVNDTCVFGAEIYICKENNTRTKGEILMMKEAVSYKHTWKIEQFSSSSENPQESKPFHAGEQKWKLELYPGGKGSGKGNNISLYLALVESADPSSQIYAEYTLRIMDQINARHYMRKGNQWFSASNPAYGWERFASQGYFYQAGYGLLVKDKCIVEAEITVHGTSAPGF